MRTIQDEVFSCIPIKEILNKQEAMLVHVENGLVFSEHVLPGEENAIVIPPINSEAYESYRLGITVVKIAEDEKSVRINW